ncbi:uncharacterized protein LOC112576814 [Pomacea canaliculata]|nr:uncharacterized protein LOC112576814 [Pomacea canaliculata]
MLLKRHFRSLLPLQCHLWCGVQCVVLLLMLVDMATAAQMCTKSVPVQRDKESRKVHVLRRVPATCSNWEKAWSWITKKDCGTKYRLDLVDLPSHDVITYKLAKVCCDGDTQCKETTPEPGANVTDDKFLAIVLGSTAAALFLLILVIGVSLCHRKRQCTLLCEEQRHVYASAEEADDCSEGEDHKTCHPSDDETENKVIESEYAEINDASLPRYTDIFKEPAEVEGPFTRASAPPLPSYEVGRERHVHFETHERTSAPRELRQSSAAAAAPRAASSPVDPDPPAAAAPPAESGKGETTVKDSSYYNVAKQKAVKAMVREEASLDRQAMLDERVIVLNGPPAGSSAACTCGAAAAAAAAAGGSGGRAAASRGSVARESQTNCTYERLEEKADVDRHEYQRLNTSAVRGGPQASPAACSFHTPTISPFPIPSEDEEEESEEGEDGVKVLSTSGAAIHLAANGHVEAATTC